MIFGLCFCLGNVGEIYKNKKLKYELILLVGSIILVTCKLWGLFSERNLLVYLVYFNGFLDNYDNVERLLNPHF